MMRRFPWILLLLGATSAVSCLPHSAPPPLVERVPYRVALHYTSDIPSPYYVLSGPFQSYARFPFNENFHHRLETYATAKSDPLASQTLDLTIHAVSLQTSYDRLGYLREAAPRLAGIGWPGDWPLSAFDSRTQDRFDDLPEQITKTAALKLRVTLGLAGATLATEDLAPQVIQVLERYDMGLGIFDYHPLISGVQDRALAEIDLLLHRALPEL